MTTVNYRETDSNEYDGWTTRPWQDHEVNTETAGELLTAMSEQVTLLWEALAHLRARGGLLDAAARRAFVNYVCLRVFHPDHLAAMGPCDETRLRLHGFDPDNLFYDMANTVVNDPDPEAWRNWEPSLPQQE